MPLKKLTPIVPNTMKRKIEMKRTLIMAVNEVIRASRESLRPSYLLMSLSGRSTFSVLRIFKDFQLSYCRNI